jgi:hypothetical protein
MSTSSGTNQSVDSGAQSQAAVGTPTDSMHSVGLSTVVGRSSHVNNKIIKDVVSSTNGHDLQEDSLSMGLLSGNTAKRPSVLRTTASYIIATEFCERLAYYGFAGDVAIEALFAINITYCAGSLVLFFETVLNMSNADSVNSFSLW